MKEIKEYFKRALAMDKELDPKGWRTNDNGKHYHINSNGEIDAGMGGKFNGQKISEVGAKTQKKVGSEKSSEKTSQTKNNYISNKDVIDYWMKKRDNLGLASHGEKMFATERLRTALVDEYKAMPNSKNIDLSNRLDKDLYEELEDIYKNNGDNEKGSAIANEIDKRKKARADFMENRMDKGLSPMPQKSEFNVKYQDTRKEKSGLSKKASKSKSLKNSNLSKEKNDRGQKFISEAKARYEKLKGSAGKAIRDYYKDYSSTSDRPIEKALKVDKLLRNSELSDYKKEIEDIESNAKKNGWTDDARERRADLDTYVMLKQEEIQALSDVEKGLSKSKSSSSGRLYKDTSGNPVPKIPAEKLKKWSDDDLLNDIADHESWLRSYAGKVNSRRDVKENIPFVRSWLQDKKKEAKRRGLV